MANQMESRMRGRRKAVDIVVPDNEEVADVPDPSAGLGETAAETADSASGSPGRRANEAVNLLTHPGTGGLLTVTPAEAKAGAEAEQGPVRIGDMMVARGLITMQPL